MTQSWEWDFWEAFSVVLSTYVDDWGRAAKQRRDLINNHDIHEIADGEITGLIAGEGQPVVFIHGTPACALRWGHYLKNVPEGYCFIAIDRMGFGQRGDQKPKLDRDYRVLADYIRKLKNPIILGHSLGGAIATRLAVRVKNIKGLVLVASSIDPELERIVPIQEYGRKKWLSWILSRSIRNSNEEMFQLKKFMKDTEPHLDLVTMPVHVIHAKDDHLVPFANVDYAKNHFKNIILDEIETAGHVIPWAQPEIIINAIQEMGTDRGEAA